MGTLQEDIKRLSDAAFRGDCGVLAEMIHRDPMCLSRSSSACNFGETFLHIAVIQGHQEFAEAVFRHDPHMAVQPTLAGQTCLHLAAARGHLSIVRSFLKKTPGLYKSIDEYGRTPLHLAVMKGFVDVVEVLTRVDGYLDQYTSSTGETIIHIAVRYNRLAVLRVLLQVGRFDAELLNMKDEADGGNTALHRAVHLNQPEMVRFLLDTTVVNVNALNGDKHTPLDVCFHGIKDLNSIKIQEMLGHKGGRRFERASSPNLAGVTQQRLEARNEERREGFDDIVKRVKLVIMSATILGTLCFKNVNNPPGGLWSPGSEEVKRDPSLLGRSVMSSDHQTAFWWFNTIAFLTCQGILFLCISGFSLSRNVVVWALRIIMWVAMIAVTFAYIFAGRQTLPNGHTGFSGMLSEIALILWIALISLVFLGYGAKRFMHMWKTVRRFRQRVNNF